MFRFHLLIGLLSLVCVAVDSQISFAKNPWEYGNWGGPGHSGPGKPVDSQDRNYQKHDQAYSGKGTLGWRGSREDARLIERSAVTIVNPFNDTRPYGRIHGAAAMGVFSAKPSLYETRVFGKKIYIPSTGARSVVLHGQEQAFNKVVKPAAKVIVSGTSKAANSAKRFVKKLL